MGIITHATPSSDPGLIGATEWDEEHATTETGTFKVLSPDGAGGVTWVDYPVGPGADVTLVGSGSDSGASPLSISAPGTIAAGDMIFLAVQTTNSAPNASGPDGTGWTEVYRIDASSNEWQALYVKTAVGDETAFDITHSAGTECAAIAFVFRGVDTIYSMASILGSVNGASTPPTIGHPSGLHICIWSTTTGASPMALVGSAMTEIVSVASGGTYDARILAAYRSCHAAFDAPPVAISHTATNYSRSTSIVAIA